MLVATKAGHTDGHHSHTDIGTLIYNLDGESLLCDPGRGLYSKDYFRQARYQNIFCNSIGHSVPRIGGQLAGARPRIPRPSPVSNGTMLDVQPGESAKSVRIEMKGAYDLPTLTGAERRLQLDAASGVLTLADSFRFAGAPLEVEEAFVTWSAVDARGACARITGKRGAVELTILEPAGAVFARAEPGRRVPSPPA